MSDIIAGGNIIANMTLGVFVLEDAVRTMEPTELLEASPASIIAAYLIDEKAKMSRPTDNDVWPLYVSSMPDGENVEQDCGCVYDTSGVKDGRYMRGAVVMHQGIQIRMRSRVYETGYAKIEALASELDSIARYSITIDVGTFLIENASRSTDIVPLGVEPGTRRSYLFTVNYLLSLSRLT